MNTLKSASLVIVLLGVLYGVYVVLSKPELIAPPAAATQGEADIAPPLIEYGAGGDTSSQTATPGVAPSAVGADDSQVGAHGGVHQPNLDSPASLPPPTTVPGANLPADPSLAGADGTTRRSNYETPASPGPTDTAPALEPESPSGSPAPGGESSRTLTAWSLRQDWQAAEQLVAEGKFHEALAKLSPYHGHPDLTADEHAQLTPWLDALAAKVIYSREHLLAAPYQVRRSETLFDVAQQCQVPWPLLLSINHELVNDPQIIVPGTQLKVVPGPFRAEVNLTTSEVTLLLGELYAGRFPFALGDEPPQPGSYSVQNKRADRTYYAADGRTIPANDPTNPYGGTWIDLGHEACIHGSPVAAGAPVATRGCISLSPQDAKDLDGILSIGSEVTIRR